MEGNNLRLMVGNEFFDYKANNIDIDIEIDIPNLIDYGFNIPNIPDLPALNKKNRTFKGKG